MIKKLLFEVAPQLLAGIAMWLFLYGAGQVQPKLWQAVFDDNKIKELLSWYDEIQFAADLRQYGVVKGIAVIFFLPILFNVLCYIIAGAKITIGIQIFLYILTHFVLSNRDNKGENKTI